MTAAQVEKLLDELCYFNEVDITHNFSSDDNNILQVKCLTENSKHTFVLTYPDSDQVVYIKDKTEAVQSILNVISKYPPT
ncbi:hypothetical protein NDQ57_01305 [Rossellomorea marisflavi]|uniref:hypothetical protein n=1 Tax=Rossellomorea marisflavi TaxID=189381 RepID=UPI00203C7492|nr:hypothetical protein [Rossellomorea marisflavi]MCM2603342.1 hypothetical protein [Rossellomorea marisflavi]